MSKFKRVAVSGSGGGGPYLKIEDNSSVIGVVRGEVLEFYQIWPKGGDKQMFDSPTPGASPRFRVNFIVYEEKRFTAKIWEYPPTVSNMLADIADSYNLETTKIKISKTKQGKQTTYMILPLAGEKDRLSEKTVKEIAAVNLNILSIRPSAQGDQPPEYPSGHDSREDIPF